MEQSGVRGGFVVHLGCGDGAGTAELRGGEKYLVHGLGTSAANVAAARARLRIQAAYGPVSVDVWGGKHLPYADNFVNLIVLEHAAISAQKRPRPSAAAGWGP